MLVSISILTGCLMFFIWLNWGQVLWNVTRILSQGTEINLEGTYGELKDIEEELKNYNVYLTGETHGTHLSYEMQKYMAKYFIENHGVKYIILEVPVSFAEILNEYLETGDLNTLKNTINKFKSTFADNQDTYNLYKFYYEYNKQLPEEKKITFVGIDIEHAPEATGVYINRLIKDLGEPPEEISEMVSRMKVNGNFYDRFFLKDLRKSLDDNTKEYKEYLGEDFFYFNIVVKNIILEWSNSEREEIMVQNFIEFYERLDGEKYYGQCGSAHVYKINRTQYIDENEEPISTFANSLNNDYGALNGKVYSMIYMYMNSYLNSGGKKMQCNDINIPYFKGDGEVRLYNPEKDKGAYEILMSYRWQREDLGDLFFLIKYSEPSPQLVGE